jgi:hypothetical protein
MEAMLESLCIAILISTSKNILSFLFLFASFFNKIGEKGRTGSAWKRRGRWKGEGDRGRG